MTAPSPKYPLGTWVSMAPWNRECPRLGLYAPDRVQIVNTRLVENTVVYTVNAPCGYVRDFIDKWFEPLSPLEQFALRI